MKRRKKALFAFVGAVALASFSVAFLRFSGPEGIFEEPAIGFGYWEFKTGAVWMNTGNWTNREASYTRSGNRWVYQAYGTNPVYFLESSLFGFSLNDSNGGIALPKRRRLFIRPKLSP